MNADIVSGSLNPSLPRRPHWWTRAMSSWRQRRQAAKCERQVAFLDNRLREDIGLPSLPPATAYYSLALVLICR